MTKAANKKTVQQVTTVVDEMSLDEILEAKLAGLKPPGPKIGDVKTVVTKVWANDRSTTRKDHLGQGLPYDRELDGPKKTLYIFQPITQNELQGRTTSTIDDDKHRSVDGQPEPVKRERAEVEYHIWAFGWRTRFGNLDKGDECLLSGTAIDTKPANPKYNNSLPCIVLDSATAVVLTKEGASFKGNSFSFEDIQKALAA